MAIAEPNKEQFRTDRAIQLPCRVIQNLPTHKHGIDENQPFLTLGRMVYNCMIELSHIASKKTSEYLIHSLEKMQTHERESHLDYQQNCYLTFLSLFLHHLN